MTNTMVKHLIFQIFIVFLLIQLAYAAEPKYYSLYLNNEKGEISIVEKKLIIYVSKYSTEGRGLFDLLLENWLLILFAAGILFVAGVIALALLKGRKEGNDGE